MKRWLDRAVDFLLAALLLVMATVVFLQVVFRYVLNSPLAWPEEVARMTIVWLSFIGAYVAMREKKHVAFDLLTQRFPPNVKLAVEVAGHAFVALFLLVVVREGWEFASRFQNVAMPYTGVSTGLLVYTVFPVSGVLMLLQSLIHLSDALARFRSEAQRSKGAIPS